jgi:hypothetical protein
MMSSRNARARGLTRIAPIGTRIVLVVPDSATRKTNFCQISFRISSLNCASMPA